MSSEQLDDRAYLRQFEENPKHVRHPFFTCETGVEYTWTNKKILGGPRDQKNTYTCVHQVMEALLGAVVAKEHGVLRYYSSQQLIDCMHHKCKTQDGNGCCPSSFEEVFKYLKTSKGIVEEQIYRFQARKGNCRDRDCDENPSTQTERSKRIQGQEDYIPDDTSRASVLDDQLETENLTDFEKMKILIKTTPVAITLESTAVLSNFMGEELTQNVYPILSRVSKGKSATQKKGPPQQGPLRTEVSEHALLIIGYGTEPDTKRKFYLAINSWRGDKWGFGGYIKLGVDMFPKGSKAYYFKNVSIS